jgi:hypothetical protein
MNAHRQPGSIAPDAQKGSCPVRGRRPEGESRSSEFRQRLIAWKQTPVAFRPSLRALARELGTSHQLLSHYLSVLEEWRREKDLERLRAQAKTKNLTLTPEVEKHYLAWLRKIEERQARDAAKAAKWASRHAALLESLKQLLPDSWNDSTR